MKQATKPQFRADRVVITTNQNQKRFHGLISNIAYFIQQFSNFIGQGSSIKRQGRFYSQADNKILGWQIGMLISKDFANHAPHQVTIYRAAKKPLCDDQAKPCASS